MALSYIWRKSEAPAEEAADAANEETEAAANGRLRRVVGRTERVDTPVTSPEISPRLIAATGLATNGFALLGVGIDASAETINRAVDDLSFEPDSDPDALNAARARLMSARDRLAEELGWLPELSQELLASVRAALAKGDLASLEAARDATIGMARLNLSLALAEAFPDDADRAARVVGDGRSLDADPLFDRLNDGRSQSGFRPIDRAAFDQAMLDRARAVARNLAPVFAASATPRAVLTRTLQAGRAGFGGFGPTFVDELLRLYAAEIDAALEQAAARIKAAVAALGERPGDQKQAGALAASLDLWSSLRRPIQVHEAARGLDDPASAAIFDEVRALTVSLSNDHEEFEIALRLARSLIASFALVPFHRNALERELPVLIGNALGRRLKQICDSAKADRSAFARSVSAGGLVRGSGPAGELAATFADAVTSTPDSRAAYFMIVRNLAVDLHNDHRDRRTALAMTQWLASQDPPSEIAERLATDLATLGAPAPARQEVPDAAAEAPVQFGRAGARAPGTAPPAPPPPQRRSETPPPAWPPQRGNEAPPPAWPPRRQPRHRRKVGPLQTIIAIALAVSYCSTRNTRFAQPRETAEPVVAGPRQSYRIAQPDYREIYAEQRAREIQIRAENDRIRQDYPAPSGPPSGLATAPQPIRPTGTSPVPMTASPMPRQDASNPGYSR